MAKQKKKKDQKGTPSSTIALNKKARHDFIISDKFECGIALEGWEVKSLREGKVQLVDAYVFIKKGEVWVSNMLITPLQTVSTHIRPEPTRVRKLLLHRREIDKLIGAVDQKGFTLVPTALYWSKGKVKMEIALAKGKKTHDKRADEKERDWQREKSRMLKSAR